MTLCELSNFYLEAYLEPAQTSNMGALLQKYLTALVEIESVFSSKRFICLQHFFDVCDAPKT